MMDVSRNIHEDSPEPPISELCMNLESQFINVQDLSKAEGMHVYARLRPMLKSEIKAGYKECIVAVDDQTVRAAVPASSAKFKSTSHLNQDITEDFTFTAAYGPETGQFVFFQECMMNTMLNFIEGQNSLVFSYGITGSGKTFTLQGNTDNPGIIPLSLHLFFSSVEDQILDKIIVKPDKFADVIVLNANEIQREIELKEQLLSNCEQEEWQSKSSSSKKSLAMILCDTFSEKFEAEARETTLCPEEMAQAQAAALMKDLSRQSVNEQTGYCSIWVSFVEIYNENIYDLLQPNLNQRSKLTLGEDKNGDVYVKGLQEICVSNSSEALKLLKFGQKNLNIASTKLNYKSSRSHCIFTVKSIRIPDPENITYANVNRLSFCDLAGSERAAKSQTTGLRLKEAGCINTSLLVLGRCIEQLRLKPSLRDKKLIPFRESKLTRLFSGFFTGRGKAVMITNASPSELTFDETLHALRFSALAKELILNDNYIATASNTLQSITNLWNARANASLSSDKSISFEDSVDEVIQEKDELIEKLLDLAESLRNKLEKETKEKAALEVKVREDVCDEYSVYSDELLEIQKQNFIEEREAIKEVYKKRIEKMEKMYENIIKEYRLHRDESDSSENESFEDDQNEKKIPEAGEMLIKNECMQITENDSSTIITEKEITLNSAEKTKQELEKTVDYTLSLETEMESLRKKLEDTKLQLDSVLKDNDEMKKELDAYKIDCFALKTENDGLFKEKLAFEETKGVLEEEKSFIEEEKSALEEDIKSLSEKLAFITQEKEVLQKGLIDSEAKVANQCEELLKLSSRIEELEKIRTNYQKSVEEANCNSKEAEDVLKSVSKTLDNAMAITIQQKKEFESLESECTSLRKEIADIQEIKEDLDRKLDSTSKELEFEKSKKMSNSGELIKIIEDLTEKLDKKKSECLKYQNELSSVHDINETLEEKLSSVFKEPVQKKMSLKQEIDSGSKLSEALCTIDEQKKEIEAMLNENSANENKITELQKLNKVLEDKLKSEIEQEKMSLRQEIDSVSSKLNEALCTIDEQKKEIEAMLNENSANENKITELQKLNKVLEDKLKSEIEQEKMSLRQEIDSVSSKLNEALCTIDEQKKEIEAMLNENSANQNKITELQKLNEVLDDKLKSEIEQEKMSLRQEIDSASSKLNEALCTIDEQKKEIETLLNESSAKENKITELQKLNEVLEDKLKSEIEQEKMSLRQEIDFASNKLNAALCTIDEQKKEIEALLNENSANENKISELRKLNEMLEDKMKSETENLQYKTELDEANKKLEEAQLTIDNQARELEKLLTENKCNENEVKKFMQLNKQLEDKIISETEWTNKQEPDDLSQKLKKAESTINEQKKELENLLSDRSLNENEIDKLEKIKVDLKNKLNSQFTQTDIILELVQILENCELKASDKVRKIHSDNVELKSKLENLKSQIQTDSEEHEKERASLYELIQILQNCEVISSNNTKEFHTSSLKQVEQIMDLEKTVKSKDIIIQCLRNDISHLQRQLKELPSSFKKQLQTERQQFIADISEVKDKENVSLKQKISQLESEKESLKNQLEKAVENKKMELEVKKEKFGSEAQNLRIQLERLENSVEIVNEDDVSEAVLDSLNTKNMNVQTLVSNKKSEEPKIVAESPRMKENSRKERTSKRRTTKSEKQGDKRKNKVTSEKSDTSSEDKKSKTTIYEETDESENSKSGKVRKEKKTAGRELRCKENVSQNLSLKLENRNTTSTKTKSSKRKQQNDDDNVSKTLALKKNKLHDMNDIENMPKPQNLRVQLLKANIAINNDITAPSPRMTRGRKRTLMAKNVNKMTASPRTLRS